jgi:hypothetical protein
MMHVVPSTSSFNQRITKYDRESKRMGKRGEWDERKSIRQQEADKNKSV